MSAGDFPSTGSSQTNHSIDRVICNAISTNGWIVVPNFIDAQTLTHLNEVMAERRGKFQLAGMGRSQGLTHQVQTRGDSTLWIENGDPQMTQSHQRMADLQNCLNQELFLGLHKLEWHFAKYPIGSRYDRHLDQHRGSDSRVITVVQYLNQNWHESSGGQLRLYIQPGVSVDIVPYGGTLVVFRSEMFEHEVLPASAERLSLTGWYRRRD